MGQVRTIQAERQSLIPLGAVLHRPKALDLGEGVQLRRGRTHEVTGAGADMFAVLAAAAHGRDLFWLGLRRDIVTLNPVGLQAYLKVEQIILVEAVSRGELLWAADQALRAPGGFCVILDMPDTLSLKESRRLQLAAEQGGGIGLILLRGPAATSAAQTRWACQPVCAEQTTWDWTCLKGKNGETGHWRMTSEGPQKRGQNAKDTLHMAAAASA